MSQDFELAIENFRNELTTQIEKSKTGLTQIKSNNFYSDFEKETDRLDKFANDTITIEFSKIPLGVRNEERERLRVAFLQVNIHLRNEFRQSYIEMRDLNTALID